MDLFIGCGGSVWGGMFASGGGDGGVVGGDR